MTDAINKKYEDQILKSIPLGVCLYVKLSPCCNSGAPDRIGAILVLDTRVCGTLLQQLHKSIAGFAGLHGPHAASCMPLTTLIVNSDHQIVVRSGM